MADKPKWLDDRTASQPMYSTSNPDVIEAQRQRVEDYFNSPPGRNRIGMGSRMLDYRFGGVAEEEERGMIEGRRGEKSHRQRR